MKKYCPPNVYGQRLGCTTIATPAYYRVYIGPKDEIEAITIHPAATCSSP